jgi:hypothetical protein
LPSPVTIDPFGGEQTLSWTGTAFIVTGTFTMPAEVHIVGEGTFASEDVAQVRIGGTDLDLDVQESVTPNERSAGVNTVYDYTLTVTNNDSSAVTVDWLRHWAPSDLSYRFGTSEINGTPVADPNGVSGGWLYRLSDFLSKIFTFDYRDRYVWDVPPTVINPGEQLVLTFEMEGGLDPGIYHSRGEVLVDEAPGGVIEDLVGTLLQLATAQSGEAAEITISQGFTITATHNGHQVIVSGYVMPDGIDILSWKEF